MHNKAECNLVYELTEMLKIMKLEHGYGMKNVSSAVNIH